MVSLPSFDLDSAAPALRRPVFEVSFGGGDSGGGLASALGGALGVDLGGAADQWKQSVASITIDAGLAPSVDGAIIYLSAGEESPTVALDDAGSLSLGYEDDSTALVFTGKIDALRHSIVGATSITATNGGVRLSRLRINQSYENQTAGDIVKDLTGRVEVETDNVEDGLDLPFYVLDDRRNAYQHIAALAKKSGYLAFFTPEAKLNFMPFVAGEPLQKFTYGEDILTLEVTDAAQSMGAITVIGDGAAGSKGKDAWSWLVKDPSSVKGSAGDGDPAREFQDASLRSKDATQSAAGGLTSAVQMMKTFGKMIVPGAPAVVVGGAVEIANAPQDSMNGLFLVRRVSHSYSKSEGFTSLILFSKTGEGGGSGLLGALGGLL